MERRSSSNLRLVAGEGAAPVSQLERTKSRHKLLQEQQKEYNKKLQEEQQPFVQRKDYDALRAQVEAKWAHDLPNPSNCVHCHQPIADGQRVLLNECLHALCQKDAAASRGTQAYTCPICETQSTLSGRTTAAAVTERPPPAGQTAPPLCKKCLDDDADAAVPAVFTCATCDLHLCDPHANAHRNLPKFKAHTLDPLTSAATDVVHKMVASAHLSDADPNRPLQILHDNDSEFVRNTREQLEAEVQRLKEVGAEHVKRATDVQLCLADIAQRDHDVHRKITETFGTLRGLLRWHEDTLRQQLRNESAKEQERLRNAETANRKQWRAVASAATMAHRLASDQLGVTTPGPVLLSQLAPAFMKRTENLRLTSAALTDPIPFAATVDFSVKDDVRTAIDSASSLTGFAQAAGSSTSLAASEQP